MWSTTPPLLLDWRQTWIIWLRECAKVASKKPFAYYRLAAGRTRSSRFWSLKLATLALWFCQIISRFSMVSTLFERIIKKVNLYYCSWAIERPILFIQSCPLDVSLCYYGETYARNRARRLSDDSSKIARDCNQFTGPCLPGNCIHCKRWIYLGLSGWSADGSTR